MELEKEEWLQIKAIIKTARIAIETIDFTNLGGEAHDAFGELAQAIEDFDGKKPNKP